VEIVGSEQTLLHKSVTLVDSSCPVVVGQGREVDLVQVEFGKPIVKQNGDDLVGDAPAPEFLLADGDVEFRPLVLVLDSDQTSHADHAPGGPLGDREVALGRVHQDLGEPGLCLGQGNGVVERECPADFRVVDPFDPQGQVLALKRAEVDLLTVEHSLPLRLTAAPPLH